MEPCKMPKKRLPENKGLPERWRMKGSSYYYRVPKGQEKQWDNKTEFKLGGSLPEAYKTWSERIEYAAQVHSVSDLIERYMVEITPKKQRATQSYYQLYAKKLRAVFGDMNVASVEPVHIYRYIDERSKKKKVNGRVTGGVSIAKREVSMFSDIYTHAVKWGYIRSHPFKGQIKFETERGRDRYIENWELKEFLSLQPSSDSDTTTLLIHAYTTFKLLTGLRQQDILSLRIESLKEDGIHVTPLKTKKTSNRSNIIEWSDDLKASVEALLNLRKVDISPYLVCKQNGESYYNPERPQAASGWKTIWRRYMGRVLKETRLKERFTEHDLRAKTASDLEDCHHAQKLLAHTNARTTQKYIRKPVKVRPAK